MLMVSDDVPRCQWPRAIVINTYPSEDGLVRKVTIQTPVHKLVFFVQVWKRYSNVVTNVVSALIL